VPVQLSLGTLSFVVCFAAWGLVSSLAPRFREAFHLTATQTAFLIAVPVTLGALARIPMGMLTDLYGGRVVFTVLMVVAAIPPIWASFASSYSMLLAAAFWLGLVGSSFAVGVGFVSRCGIVRSALKPRCIGCSNCVLACPFGIPKVIPEYEQMMKCDMCYDRTSVGKKPMCATVCPSQALSYVKSDTIKQRREEPANLFVFGNQQVKTRVNMMVPPNTGVVSIDVTDYMWEGHLDQTPG
jgi:ferredoxin